MNEGTRKKRASEPNTEGENKKIKIDDMNQSYLGRLFSYLEERNIEEKILTDHVNIIKNLNLTNTEEYTGILCKALFDENIKDEHVKILFNEEIMMSFINSVGDFMIDALLDILKRNILTENQDIVNKLSESIFSFIKENKNTEELIDTKDILYIVENHKRLNNGKKIILSILEFKNLDDTITIKILKDREFRTDSDILKKALNLKRPRKRHPIPYLDQLLKLSREFRESELEKLNRRRSNSAPQLPDKTQ